MARVAPSAPAARVAAAAEAAPLAFPPALTRGDTVALFSPSSHSGHEGAAHLEQARAALASVGLRPLPLEGPQRRHLYLAGSDAERAAEFQQLYGDPAVKALFATRGGYGAARMLPHLERAHLAAAPPKLVVGMSDVVALLAYLHAIAGVGALHGPCLAAPGMLTSPHRAENLADLEALLFAAGPAPPYPCELLHPGRVPGPVAGRLVGGNLTVLASLLGTDWALETAGCVLFLEDVNEQPYRTDRNLTQLRQAGRLDGVAAVVCGHFQGCDGEPPGLLHDVLRDVFRDAPHPVAIGLPAGHGPRNRALRLGTRATLRWEAPQPGAPATLSVS